MTHFKQYKTKEIPFIHDGMTLPERCLKRLADIMIAAICLILFSPLFIICAVLIWKEDGGPAIFRQERIGLYGKPFTIYKFRSMKKDAEKDGAELLQPTTDKVKYSDGTTEEVYGFDVPVEELGKEFDLAILGTKGTWYDHKVSVSDAQKK